MKIPILNILLHNTHTTIHTLPYYQIATFLLSYSYCNHCFSHWFPLLFLINDINITYQRIHLQSCKTPHHGEWSSWLQSHQIQDPAFSYMQVVWLFDVFAAYDLHQRKDGIKLRWEIMIVFQEFSVRNN